MQHFQAIIAGSGFAGLACAKAMAGRGLSVAVLERKAAPGVGMHTTGIIVGECAEEFSFPENLTRKVTDVRLYAPNMRYIDLKSPDYFFLTTDTPGLMRHLSNEAIQAGARIIYDTAFEHAVRESGKIIVNGAFACEFLIGADGPRSKVAECFSLGQNTQFLLGAEAEYKGLPLENPNAFYCFLDQKLAHGYLGWAIPGVGVAQVGLACKRPASPDIGAFVDHMRGQFDFSKAEVVARRGGLIPVGGLVKPFADGNVILVGDAAGMVSPLTAGGIHTGLRYGKLLGVAIADHLQRNAQHPAQVMQTLYPAFYFKRFMRFGFERFAPDALLNLAIGNPIFSRAASEVFFRKKKLK